MAEQNDADVDDFLAHFGVKGMKWGKHKAGSDSGSSSDAPSGTRREARETKIHDARGKVLDSAEKKVAAREAYKASADKGTKQANKILLKDASRELKSIQKVAGKSTRDEKVTVLLTGYFGAGYVAQNVSNEIERRGK